LKLKFNAPTFACVIGFLFQNNFFGMGLKGNPVKFRSYPRSCKSGLHNLFKREATFGNFSHTTVSLKGREGEVNAQARRPASFSNNISMLSGERQS
jgi:hypothetical protein